MTYPFSSFAQTVDQDRLVASFTKRLDAHLAFFTLQGVGNEDPSLTEQFSKLALDPLYEGSIGEQLQAVRSLLARPDILVHNAYQRLEAEEHKLQTEIEHLKGYRLRSLQQNQELARLESELEHNAAYVTYWSPGAKSDIHESELFVEALEQVDFANAYYRQTLRLAVAASGEKASVRIRKGLQSLLSVRGFEQAL